MTELDIHKCLISYGFFPMTLILKKLEEAERYEDCDIIINAMISYRERFKLVTDDIPTKWSVEFEKDYYSYFKKADSNGLLLAKQNIDFYIKDIEKRLSI